MNSKFNPGKNLYELYRREPPDMRRGASHVEAYRDGFEGRKCKFVRTSYGWWAYKAGAGQPQIRLARIKIKFVKRSNLFRRQTV